MAIGRWVWSAAVVLAGTAVASAQFEIPGARPAPGAGDAPMRPARPATPDPRPKSPYDLTAEHGAWLVVIKSFRGERELNSEGQYEPDVKVRELADQFAEFIRKQYKINAYVYPRGWEVRQQRNEEARVYRESAIKYYRETKGIEPTREMLRVKTVNVPDEYTVFVAPARGVLTEREMAIDFANQVRKLKAPAEFNDSLVQGSDDEKLAGKGSTFNAFLACMPGMNPTAPRVASIAQSGKVDDFVMKLNSGESYSLLHKTRKKWTLLVQTYGQGASIVQAGASGAGSGDASDRLERAAMQAQKCCELLRANKFDAYVMHTRYHSMVFVGDYATGDDPQLLASVKTFAKMQLKDQKSGKVLETFMDKPAPVVIPKP